MIELPAAMQAAIAEQARIVELRAQSIVCYAKCWGCQFGQCPGEAHTWMDDEDIHHSADTEMPTSPEDWDHLARDRPCGCPCMRAYRATGITATSLTDGAL